MYIESNSSFSPLLVGEPSPRIPKPLSILLLLVFLAGVTIVGKGPTYIGYPPIFFAEIVMVVTLGWVFLRMPVLIHRRVFHNALSLLVLAFLLYSFFRLLPCIPTWGLLAVRDSAVAYYALFFYVGLSVAAHTMLAEWFWNCLTWIWVGSMVWFYSPLLLGNGWALRISPRLPYQDYPLFMGSSSENIQHLAMGAILLLLGFPRRRQGIIGLLIIIPLILGALYYTMSALGRGVKIAVLLGSSVGIFASIGARKSVWSASRWFLVAYFLATAAIFYAIMLGPEGFGEHLYHLTGIEQFHEINPRDPKGTANWRLKWWNNIIDAMEKESSLFGLGFGVDFLDYNPYAFGGLPGTARLRSPHNVHVIILGRMGYLGFAFWLGILLLGFSHLFLAIRRGGVFSWKTGFSPYTLQRRKELTFWLIFLVATLVNGSFAALLEGPVFGVWFWFALGFATGRTKDPSAFEKTQVYPPTNYPP